MTFNSHGAESGKAQGLSLLYLGKSNEHTVNLAAGFGQANYKVKWGCFRAQKILQLRC